MPSSVWVHFIILLLLSVWFIEHYIRTCNIGFCNKLLSCTVKLRILLRQPMTIVQTLNLHYYCSLPYLSLCLSVKVVFAAQSSKLGRDLSDSVLHVTGSIKETVLAGSQNDLARCMRQCYTQKRDKITQRSTKCYFKMSCQLFHDTSLFTHINGHKQHSPNV